MSNFNRKIKKNKEGRGSRASNDMKINIEIYKLALGFVADDIFIETYTYNEKYFSCTDDLVDGYGLFFNDYIEFCNKNKKVFRVIEFLKDSVKNNQYLCDSLSECSFSVEGSHIVFKSNRQKMDYINMGEFYIDNYKVSVCSSYMFFEDILTDKKYIYYGD